MQTASNSKRSGTSWCRATRSESEWFNGNGQPKADQINATIRSLVEAFRWHFWGISWDGADHPDIPTHAGTVQGPQSIDPWFDSNGNPIDANISATLQSLVESFRWHFWGYSWDGSRHPDIPSHAEYLTGNTDQPTPPTDEGTPTPTESTPSTTPSTGPDDGNPLEGSTAYQSALTSVASFTSPDGATGSAVADGYTITLPPGVADGATSGSANYGDASFSLDIKKLTMDGNSTACLVYRASQTGTSGAYYQFCLLYSADTIVGVQAILITVDNISSATNVNTVAGFQLDTPVSALDWHTVKVIAKGDQFWFYFDGSYQGTATFSGPSTGTIGFSAYNLDTDVTQTFEFATLTVENLQP